MFDKKVLVTGGSGLLGRAVLAESRVSHILGFCRRTTLEPHMVPPGVQLTCIRGDLREEHLGLDDAAYARLAEEVEVILHLGAVTSFNVKSAQIEATNRAGTERMVELARRSGARMVYVSTAYVDEGSSALAEPSIYEQTKRDAEALVRTLPDWVIVRPSIIIGDSRTGRVAAYQGFHHIVGCMVDGTLPVLASTPGRLGDFVAQNWVADAVWGAALHEKNLGTLWVTAGADALPIEQIREIAVRVGREYGFNPPTPRLVPYDTVERLFLPVFMKNLPIRLQHQFRADLKLARYMNQLVPLPSSEPLLRAELGLPRREPEELILERNLQRWAEDRASGALKGRTLAVAPRGARTTDYSIGGEK
ncbi:MAG TPA: SDR family oxidoreductase [Thermoanaerobaculia bacterium]|nr:SDR family oxidoreductase [Thermoanaerobaculia bacterium]